MTPAADYTPPEHMQPGEAGWNVCTRIYREARAEWDALGRPRGEGENAEENVAYALIAISGVHDGWVPASALEGAEPSDLEGILDRFDWPDKDQVPELTASVKQWTDWIRETHLPQVKQLLGHYPEMSPEKVQGDDA
jgi:hypothetical protein